MDHASIAKDLNQVSDEHVLDAIAGNIVETEAQPPFKRHL
jgi:hypothetical protein